MIVSLLFLKLAAAISERRLDFPPSSKQRYIELYYQKQIDQPINIGFDLNQYNTKNTYPPNQEFLSFSLSPNEEHFIRVLAAQDSFLLGLHVFAAWIYDDDASQFFYFQNNSWAYANYSQFDRPQFHLSAPRNWINDPNGLIFLNGTYHIFYQYNPLSLTWGNMYWGHAISSDGVTWRHLPVALTPGPKINSNQTIGGAFSGGAWILNGSKLLVYYTDSLENKEDFIEVQNYSYSDDGIHFIEKTTVLSQRPWGTSKDFRDPVIIQNGDDYLMLLGTAVNGIPSIIKYKSASPLGPWMYDGVLYQRQLNSTTIECPNILKSGDQVALFFSINDLQLDSSVTLYMIGTLTQDNKFITDMEPTRMDWGGHFYAAQSYNDLLISWMQDWQKDKKYFGNEVFSGVFTLLRRGSIKNNRLYQRPIEGAKQLIRGLQPVQSEQKIFELCYLTFTYQNTDWSIEIKFESLIIGILLSNRKASLIVDESGLIDTYLADIELSLDVTHNVEIWLDRAAIEIYVNDGEAVFSQRFLGQQQKGQVSFTRAGLVSGFYGEISSIY